MEQEPEKTEQHQGKGGDMSALVRQYAEERGLLTVTVIDRGASYERLFKKVGARPAEHFAVIGR